MSAVETIVQELRRDWQREEPIVVQPRAVAYSRRAMLELWRDSVDYCDAEVERRVTQRLDQLELLADDFVVANLAMLAKRFLGLHCCIGSNMILQSVAPNVIRRATSICPMWSRWT